MAHDWAEITEDEDDDSDWTPPRRRQKPTEWTPWRLGRTIVLSLFAFVGLLGCIWVGYIVLMVGILTRK